MSKIYRHGVKDQPLSHTVHHDACIPPHYECVLPRTISVINMASSTINRLHNPQASCTYGPFPSVFLNWPSIYDQRKHTEGRTTRGSSYTRNKLRQKLRDTGISPHQLCDTGQPYANCMFLRTTRFTKLLSGIKRPSSSRAHPRVYYVRAMMPKSPPAPQDATTRHAYFVRPQL